MTLHELVTEVSALGFDGELKIDTAFMTSVKRALCHIYGERVIVGEHSFLASGEQPIFHLPVLLHRGGVEEALPLAGEGYSFYVCGSGSFTITGKAGKLRTESFNSKRLRIFGRLPANGATVTFTGEYSFSVTNLCTYANISGEGANDIPDGSPIRCYSLNDAVGDFLSFIGPATDGRGEPLFDVRLDFDKVYYDSRYCGEIKVKYRRAPVTSISDDPRHELNIPTDCELYLPLLVASYIYLDRDPEKSAHWGALYREATEAEQKRRVISVNTRYRDTNGWA